MRAKLGLPATDPDAADALAQEFLALLHEQHVDTTEAFRALSAVVRGDAAPARDLFLDREAFDAWAGRWAAARTGEPAEVAAAMDAVNPVYLPRNHLVEEALAFATAGDLAPFEALNAALAQPFTERPGLERFAAPDPDAGEGYRTFCGT